MAAQLAIGGGIGRNSVHASRLRYVAAQLAIGAVNVDFRFVTATSNRGIGSNSDHASRLLDASGRYVAAQLAIGTINVDFRFITTMLVRPTPDQGAALRSVSLRAGGAMNSGPTGSVIVSYRMRLISFMSEASSDQPITSDAGSSWPG